MTSTCIEYNHISWINIIGPTAEDLHELRKQFPDFHYLNLKDCLKELEFPKIDAHDQYLFLVIQLPVWDGDKRISQPSEVDIFVNETAVVTSHLGDLKTMETVYKRVLNDKDIRGEMMGHGTGVLLYEILHELIDYCFPIMNKVNQNIRHIEERLFSADTQHILKEISFVRRDVIALRHILRPQCDVLDTLEKGSWPFLNGEMTPYWSNLEDHLTQLKAMLDEHMDVIGGLSETIDTLASHRIDGVVRILTLITIMTAPMTLLATIFGINVDLLPDNQNSHVLLFFLVNGFGILLTIWLLMYLRKRNWL